MHHKYYDRWLQVRPEVGLLLWYNSSRWYKWTNKKTQEVCFKILIHKVYSVICSLKVSCFLYGTWKWKCHKVKIFFVQDFGFVFYRNYLLNVRLISGIESNIRYKPIATRYDTQTAGEDRRYVGDRRCIKHQNQNQKHKNEWMNHQPIIIYHI